ncbi:hypothetical protein B0H14DRAFT_3668508 [Mycena olivaceomarginata]|nr:hypothetical protein B0H14DRAFT_3668508 [Mycena olivaceomarginata]
MPGLRSQTQLEAVWLIVKIRLKRGAKAIRSRAARMVHPTRSKSYQIALAPHKKLPPEVLAIIFVNCVGTPIILPPSPKEPDFGAGGHLQILAANYTEHSESLEQYLPRFPGAQAPKIPSFQYATPALDGRRTVLIAENVDPITYPRRTVDLRFLESSIDEFFTLPAGSIERLEVLYLETLGFTMPFCHTSDEPLDVFRSAPCLRRVLFSTDLCSLDPQVLGLPWGQLTGLHFIATYIPPLAMHAILRESHSLLECSFSVIQIDAPLASALARLPACVLPALRSLMVEFSPQTTDYAPFLRPLVLPALTDLELRPPRGRPPPAVPLVAACVPRPPRALALRAPPPRDPALQRSPPRTSPRFLHGMPSLTQFLPCTFWAGARAAPPAEWDAGVLRALGRGALLARAGGAHVQHVSARGRARGARGARRGRARHRGQWEWQGRGVGSRIKR